MTPLILVAGIGMTTAPAMAKGPNGSIGSQGAPDPRTTVSELSIEEADTLLWMREEEKLARDVYQVLYAQWKDPVFQQIASSEQRHFDAVGDKIETYGLVDPALPGIGDFTNSQIQVLYDELVSSGEVSLVEGLIVGATIEDMDILDLQQSIDATDEKPLKTTYQNLLDGSKNHLRAFVGRLRDLGVEYEPRYIDALLFDAIVGI